MSQQSGVRIGRSDRFDHRRVEDTPPPQEAGGHREEGPYAITDLLPFAGVDPDSGGSAQSVDDPPSEVWRGSRCAATLAGMAREDDGTLHDSEPSLGGDTIDEAVENSEEGTQAEDTGHTPSGNEPSGDSRGEQMKDVVEHDEG